MTEPGGEPRFSQAAYDEAVGWFTRRERGRDPDTERKFERWLRQHPSHEQAYRQVEADNGDPASFADSRFGPGRMLRPAPVLRRRQTHIALASLGALLAIGAVAFGLVRTGGPFPLTASAEANVYETRAGEIRSFPLPDGSRLTLDGASRVSAAYDDRARQLRIARGRARFAAVPESARPFVVTSAEAEISAGGATFDVAVRPGATNIAVLHGTVAVRGRSGAAGPALRLAADQEVTVTERGGVQAPRPLQPGEARWVSGMIVLERTPLGTAVAAINRANAAQIQLGDPSLSALSITGAFRATDPEDFAEAVARLFGLAVVRHGPGALLLVRPH